ncbi:hypothetical protein [Kitasatospora sp. NPDC088346]|uniref:hypothetical protein n=1 Tax=Kitasatospora sp. NPDC088346 TaxID=3364073 RepID=UPI0037F74F24
MTASATPPTRATAAPGGHLHRLAVRATVGIRPSRGEEHAGEHGPDRLPAESGVPVARRPPQSHLAWFAARAAAASRTQAQATAHPMDPSGEQPWRDDDRSDEDSAPARPTRQAPQQVADAAPPLVGVGPPTRTARPARRQTPDRAAHDAALQPAGAEAPLPHAKRPNVALPERAGTRPGPHTAADDADAPAARQTLAPRSRPASAGDPAPATAPAPASAGRAADRAADRAAGVRPELPPPVLLRPRPAGPPAAAPTPLTAATAMPPTAIPARQARRRGLLVPPAPAPAPVVVRIGRVELVVRAAAPPPSPAPTQAPPAAAGHPDLLAAHRGHGGGWSG